MNPFANPPGLRPPSLAPREGLTVKSPPDKGDGRGLNVEFETRRAGLDDKVRDYADRLYSNIKRIYEKYGVSSVAEMLANASVGKGPKLRMKEVKELDELIRTLADVLDRNRIPAVKHEYPPLEAFQDLVEKINESITPSKVTGLDHWENYELIDGELNGRVEVDKRELPVIGGELIREIEGHEILGCSDIHNINGKLNGSIFISRLTLPVIDGVLIREIDGQKIENCYDVRNIDGKLNGEVSIGERTLPVIAGEVVREIAGQKIHSFHYIQNIAGKLYGTVGFSHYKVKNQQLPVMAGEVVREIDGQEIEYFSQLHVVDGKMNGIVQIGGRWLPVMAGKVVREIGGQEITQGHNARNIGGKLNCTVEIKGFTYPVIAGELIREIEGMKIERCPGASNVNGKLTARIWFVDGPTLPVIAGRLIREIEGHEIVGVLSHDDAGGVFNGVVGVKSPDGKNEEKRVVLGKFVD